LGTSSLTGILNNLSYVVIFWAKKYKAAHLLAAHLISEQLFQQR
jgi:hypothetical protein